ANLHEFVVRSVTQGKDAQGEVTLELEVESDDQSYRGRAASTDIIEASAQAYLNAVNAIATRKERGHVREVVGRPGAGACAGVGTHAPCRANVESLERPGTKRESTDPCERTPRAGRRHLPANRDPGNLVERPRRVFEYAASRWRGRTTRPRHPVTGDSIA